VKARGARARDWAEAPSAGLRSLAAIARSRRSKSPTQTNTATLGYSLNGVVQTVADAKNNLTTRVLDGFDRASKVEFPMPSTPGTSNPADYEGYSWDADGNLLVKTLRQGGAIDYAYDALGRLVTFNFPGFNYGVSYCYDLLNRPLSAQLTTTQACPAPATGSVLYAWDALSRLTSETTAGRMLTYAYDAAGDRTKITWPDASPNTLAATYAFDTLQRVTTISANGTQIVGYGYDAQGRRSTITRGSDPAGTTYGYDGADRLVSLAQGLTGGAAVTWTLGYDPAGRLISRQASNTAYIWHQGTANTAYTANGLNQYPTITPGGTSAYDIHGNTTFDASTGTTFTYDGLNRLVAGNAPTPMALVYDAASRIQTKSAAGAATTFLYSGQMLVGEYGSAGAILNRYIPGPGQDEAALWYSGAGVATPRWLHADAQGSTIAWSNSAGASLGTLAYDSFGQPSTWSGPRYAYTGQLMLPEAHVYHYKARAYAPGLGRFLQTDPAGLASDLNVYAYVGNDPVDGSDPTGLAGPLADVGDQGSGSGVSEVVVTAQRIATPQYVSVSPGNVQYSENFIQIPTVTFDAGPGAAKPPNPADVPSPVVNLPGPPQPVGTVPTWRIICFWFQCSVGGIDPKNEDERGPVKPDPPESVKPPTRPGSPKGHNSPPPKVILPLPPEFDVIPFFWIGPLPIQPVFPDPAALYQIAMQ